MKRKILSILYVCLLVFALSGCLYTSYQDSVDVTSHTISKGNGYFTLITEWSDGDFVYQVVYANDTNVKYLISYNVCYQQGAYGITPLYNADGTVQVYEKE